MKQNRRDPSITLYPTYTKKNKPRPTDKETKLLDKITSYSGQVYILCNLEG